MNIEKLQSKIEKLRLSDGRAVPYHDIVALLDELEIYQTEMELQNHELREAKTEIDHLRQGYMDLYLLAPVGYLIIDEMGTILDLNVMAAQKMKCKRHAAINANLDAYLTASAKPRFSTMLSALKLSPAPHTVELTLKQSPSPAEMHVRVVAQAYYDGDQMKARLTMTNITDRIEAEKHLRESEARFRRAVIDAPEPIMVYTEDGEVILLSQVWAECTGYNLHDLPTVAHWMRHISPNMVDQSQSDVERLYEMGMAHHDIDYVIKTQQGQERIWEFSSSSMGALPDGRRIMMSMAHDVTESRHYEHDLQQSEARHRDIAENMPGIVFQFVMQMDGKTYFSHLSGNENAVRKFGFALSDVLDDPTIYYNSIVPEDFMTYGQVLLQSAQTMSSYSLEFRLRRPVDDELVWLHARATPRPLTHDSIIWTGIVTDITDYKAAEAAVKQLTVELEHRIAERTAELAGINKELEAFNYSVSHDLRAPLRTLDGFSQALIEDYGDQLDDEGKHYLNRIRIASQNMNHLIQSLLDLSRLSRQGFNQQTVDLSALCREIADGLQQDDPNKVVEFSIEDGLVVQGDKSLLAVALQNLLGNAWKFTHPNVTAHIVFGRTTDIDTPEFFVRDNGVGFDMDYVNKLFVPFQRLHTRAEFEGTGIGLATVQRVIHRHGGSIRAESVLGKGASFYFTLNAG